MQLALIKVHGHKGQTTAVIMFKSQHHCMTGWSKHNRQQASTSRKSNVAENTQISDWQVMQTTNHAVWHEHARSWAVPIAKQCANICKCLRTTDNNEHAKHMRRVALPMLAD
jgi:hypothetical protein